MRFGLYMCAIGCRRRRRLEGGDDLVTSGLGLRHSSPIPRAATRADAAKSHGGLITCQALRIGYNGQFVGRLQTMTMTPCS